MLTEYVLLHARLCTWNCRKVQIYLKHSFWHGVWSEEPSRGGGEIKEIFIKIILGNGGIVTKVVVCLSTRCLYIALGFVSNLIIFLNSVWNQNSCCIIYIANVTD